MPLLLDTPLPIRSLIGRRILVVDDDPVCRSLTAELLRDAGAEVDSADDGRPAVLAVAHRTPDLVVTDLDMPGVDGLAAAGIVRWDLGLVDLPIIAISAAAPSPAELLAAGIDACLTKPVNRTELLAAVVGCLARSLAAPAPGAPTAAGRDFHAAGALERVGGREELLQRMVEIFTKEHGDSGRRLDAALGRGEPAVARRICHALRGTGASLGAGRLQRTAALCEEALAAGREPTQAALRDLQAALAEALAAMAAWSGRSRGDR